VPTGLQEFFPYDQVDEDQYLDSRLAQIGITPAQLDYVALSHLHFDHAGNVRTFAGAGPRLVVNDKEKDWAFGYEGAFNGAHLKADYEGIDFETVSGDTEFLPGVTFIEAPGHTPGTMAMKVDLPPSTPAAIVNDLSAWYASVEKLRGLAEKSDATVVFGHDAEQLHSLRRAPDGFYA
jgi:glyoxylase-like metal-dependent hydrolase (beta-lactamase superfamily II)